MRAEAAVRSPRPGSRTSKQQTAFSGFLISKQCFLAPFDVRFLVVFLASDGRALERSTRASPIVPAMGAWQRLVAGWSEFLQSCFAKLARSHDAGETFWWGIRYGGEIPAHQRLEFIGGSTACEGGAKAHITAKIDACLELKNYEFTVQSFD